MFVGSLSPTNSFPDRMGILSTKGICQTLKATDYKDPQKIAVKKKIAAMRGRNSDNTVRERMIQKLEIGGEVSNTLTTVQKDNMVVEISNDVARG